MDPIFNLDSAAMQAAADKMSFSQHPQYADLAAKATRGDVDALAQLLDFSGRSAYMQSTTLNTTIAEKAAMQMAERMQTYLPREVVNIQSQQHLMGSNSAFSDPALAPMVDAIRSKVMEQFPNSTPTQIAEHTNRYLTNFAEAVSPKAAATAPAMQTKSNFNQSDFFK